jgi:C4-type Zn-finger protein
MTIKITRKGKVKKLAKKCPSCNSVTFKLLFPPEKKMMSIPVIIIARCKRCGYQYGVEDG